MNLKSAFFVLCRSCAGLRLVAMVLMLAWQGPRGLAAAGSGTRVFRAGAYAMDVTPTRFPVIVNGGFLSASADQASDPLHARFLVLDDGETRVGLCVLDTCLIPREFADAAKREIAKSSGLPPERVMISATHTHAAPSLMTILGTDADPHYPGFLLPRLAEGFRLAAANLAPARVGWAVISAPGLTHNRVWIRRPDKVEADPFGERIVRANMHPGHENPNVIAPSGPVDPDLSLLAVQALDGRPLAVLANYSMHYHGGARAVSADYFGRFADHLARMLGATGGTPAFVGMMSQGTSGDLQWMDYGKPARNFPMDAYAASLARLAHDAYRTIEWRDWVSIAMRDADLPLRTRQPSAQRLAWARGVVEAFKGRIPRTIPEVYAREQIWLHENPVRPVKLQALRIGELGIVTSANEVFAISGLKVKAQSPLRPTFFIELANGEEGYIPPPEHHALGSYNTWACRSAGLEVDAENKVVERLIELLEEVSGKPRRAAADAHGPYAEAVLASKPAAYWRMNEFDGRRAADATGQGRVAVCEPGVVFYLDGPESSAFSGTNAVNRAFHFAGGRMKPEGLTLGETYSVELWFWNGLPYDARPVTGHLISVGRDGGDGGLGEHLSIGGARHGAGRLVFADGGGDAARAWTGRTELKLKEWHHVALVREGAKFQVYLDGNPAPELSGEIKSTTGGAPAGGTLFLGGRSDGDSSFEGKLDEASVYTAALTPETVAGHFLAARGGVRTGAAVEPGAGSEASPPSNPARSHEPAIPPKGARESMAALRLAPGFEVELMASEPRVMDPVALDWGPDGRLWVVEMADYPLGVDGRGQAGGRLRVLEDLDGDGRYDASKVVWDGINFPTGLMTWREGVLVTAAPDIVYVEEGTEAGKPKTRRVLYSGFKEGNTQLRVNGLRWGLDNWIYCASSWSGGTAESVAGGGKVVLSGRDLRIRPDEGALDAQAGVTQFGRNRNDWGDWFGVNNSYPIWHFALPDQYTRRNAFVPLAEPIVQLAGRNPKIYPAKPPEKRFHNFQESGRFTSACSTMIYRDELLFGPGEDEQHAFVCEPFHNLVHRAVLARDGLTFQARRARGEEEREFLASEDHWSRPVMAATGPDGALWVVDMYRYTIEHPEFLPPEGKAELAPFYRLGNDRGRIYRVFRKGKRPRPIPNLAALSTVELAGALDSPNGWQRDKAQQMLLWRRDPAAVPALERIARTSGRALARLHAFCALDGLGALSLDLLRLGLNDGHAGVRRELVRLAETRLDHEQVEADLSRLAEDSDPRVRQQVAFSLGASARPSAGKILARLLARDSGDPYFRAAVLSSAGNHAAALASASMSDGAAGEAYLEPLTALCLGLNRRDLAGALAARAMAPARGSGAGAGAGADAGGPSRMRSAARILDHVGKDISAGRSSAKDWEETLRTALPLFAEARRIVRERTASGDERSAAAGLLGRESGREALDRDLLGDLLGAQSPPEVQRAAVKALTRSGDAGVPGLLFPRLAGSSPEMLLMMVDELLSREEWTLALLEAMKTGAAEGVTLDASRKERLQRHRSETVRTLAQEALRTRREADRQAVIREFQPALKLAGRKESGAVIYQKLCASCHAWGELGPDLGPNLRTVTGHAPERLLSSILDPSAEVEPRFFAYACVLANDEELYGLIASETGASLTFKLLDGSQRTVARSEIKSLRNSRLSLMPVGLEAGMSAQDMADLLEFIRRP